MASDESTEAADREPIQAWMENFAKEVKVWCEAGEKIIIHMDANSDVRTGPVATTLRPLGFEEQVTFRHEPLHPPPATHMANTRGIPIDGVWTNFSFVVGTWAWRKGFQAY